MRTLFVFNSEIIECSRTLIEKSQCNYLYDMCVYQVSRAKVQLKANMLMQLDSFSNTCEDIGRQILTYGRRMSNEEVSLDPSSLFHQSSQLIDMKHAT